MQLSKSHIAKTGGSISSIIVKFAPKILKLARAVLGTLTLASALGAISGDTKKATSGDGAVRRDARKGATNKKGAT